jgi:hypothetical protein
MREWFDAHPEGTYSISPPLKIFRSRKTRTDYVPVSVDESNYYFSASIRDGKGRVILVWHCLRQAFCSNCAARVVDRRLINARVGDKTPEMSNAMPT